MSHVQAPVPTRNGRPYALAARYAAGILGVMLAVWLGMQPLGAWLTPTPNLAPIAVQSEMPRGTTWLSGLLRGTRWQADIPEQTTRHFDVPIPDTVSTMEAPYLWLPQVEQRFQVLSPEGQVLHDTVASGFRGGPIRSASALVALPAASIGEQGGHLELAVTVELNRIGTPGPVYIADWSDLEAAVHRHRLLEGTLRPAMLGALLLLAAMSVGLVVLRPKDGIYYWLAATMIPYAMVEMGLITAFIPPLSRVDDQLFAVSGIGTLQLIGLLLTVKGRPPPTRVAIGLFLIYVFLVGVTFLISEPALVRLSMAMVLGSVVPIVIFVVSHGFESAPGRRLMDGALACALVAFVAGVVHDVLLKLGVHAEGIYVFRYVSFVLLAWIFGVVVKRQSGIADSLDQANDRLKSRLRQQEAELADYHRREAETLQSRAAEAERERITADLHDGMAGYLATIVALSEREGAGETEISNLAKDALTDLRFVIDATSISSPELRLTLSILRERCMQPLDALGIELGWSMIELPDDVHLSHVDNLHVLRILQEALNNAVRHGEPRIVEVYGRSISDADELPAIELVLENRGGRAPSPDRVSAGYGTANMAKRAAALGGSIEVTPLVDGARLRLVFPLPA